MSNYGLQPQIGISKREFSCLEHCMSFILPIFLTEFRFEDHYQGQIHSIEISGVSFHSFYVKSTSDNLDVLTLPVFEIVVTLE